MKKDLIKISIDEIYSKPLMTSYPTNKITYNHIDEIWSIDLADMINYKFSKIKGFINIFVKKDNFSKCSWCIPLKNKTKKTNTHETSKFITSTKRSPPKIESDRGAEFFKSVFQNFLKNKNKQHYS